MGLRRCDAIVTDWPWQFGDRLPGPGRGASKHYDTMPASAAATFPLPSMKPHVHHFFWRVASMQQEALDILGTWGFTVKSELVWVKKKPCLTCGGSGRFAGIARSRRARARGSPIVMPCLHCRGTGLGAQHMGMGRRVRNNHEVCLIATRGSPKVHDHSIPSVFEAPVGRHSAKPDKFYDIVRRLTGPRAVRVELFARVHRPGFICYGNELEEAHP